MGVSSSLKQKAQPQWNFENKGKNLRRVSWQGIEVEKTALL